MKYPAFAALPALLLALTQPAVADRLDDVKARGNEPMARKFKIQPD